jgi:hypothetical protein
VSRFLSNYTDIEWTLVGFLIFITLFILFVTSTYLKSQILIHRYLERLPLEDSSSRKELES